MKKTTQLKNLLQSKEISVIMEAHNGLTARLAEEAGFSGIWASGLSISASLGVRDNNEASWTQVLDVVEYMSDATSGPILLDGDTGYGNFNNFQRLIKKLEQRNIAGVCIEDKLFPKTNSFIAGEKQPLAAIDEFCGKIKAGKDTQSDPDFIVVARTEAFIAGWGLEEALKRAEAYHNAGADAILIHSKKNTPEQIITFSERWNNKCPVVIVPTMYPDVELSVYQKAGISLVIFANHTVRTVITAVQKNLKKLYETKSLMSIENEIVPVKEIFRLQDASTLEKAEKVYLPVTSQTKSIILAASQGKGFGNLTSDKPKCMIPIKGKPILSRLIEVHNDCGIKQLYVVRGYKKESVNLTNINYFDHPNYENTGENLSLFQAIKEVDNRTIIAYGDIMVDKYVLQQLLDQTDDITIVVDSAITNTDKKEHKVIDYVIANNPPSLSVFEGKVLLKEIGSSHEKKDIHGEWIGLALLNPNGSQIVNSTLKEMSQKPDFDKTNLVDLFTEIMKKGHSINVMYIHGHWLDIDDLEDLSDAYNF